MIEELGPDGEVIDDMPKPVDMLFAALTMILVVLGIVLVALASADSAPPPRRVPVIPASNLVVQYGDWQG